MNNDQFREPQPIETYTFRYSEEEVKEIHQKQLKPVLLSLIMCIAYILVMPFVWVLLEMPNILFGILTGMILLCAIVYIKGILVFKKSAKASRQTVPKREYVYSFYQDTFRIEILENETKINEENRSYAELQAITEIGSYFLLTLAGRIFIIRKAALAPNSVLLTSFPKPIKNTKKHETCKLVVLILALVCLIVSTVFGAISKLTENDPNASELSAYEQEMRAVIAEEYDEYELLAYFNVKKEDQVIDVLCLVEQDGKVDVLSYCSYDGKQMILERLNGMHVEYGVLAGVTLLDGTNDTFAFYASESEIPRNVSVKEPIDWEGKRIFFCVTMEE